MSELLTKHQEKAKEYASESDRLANFRHGADLERRSPEQYLLGLVAKHEIALRDFAERMAKGEEVSLEQVMEKTGDIIIYMILLEGLSLEILED